MRTDAEPFGAASFLEYTAYRDATRAFSDVAAFPYSITSVSVAADGMKEQAVATAVSPNFFSVLGVARDQRSARLRTSSAATPTIS